MEGAKAFLPRSKLNRNHCQEQKEVLVEDVTPTIDKTFGGRASTHVGVH